MEGCESTKNSVFHAKPLHLEFTVYRKKPEDDQPEFIDFYLKFGGRLNPRNRWVRLAKLIPWEEFEAEYAKLFPSHTGAPAKPFRMALGALLIKEMKHLSDEELVEDITENPYYQYLLGLPCYQDEAPFDASSLVHFRKRISPEVLQEINEKIVKRQIAQKQAAAAREDDNDDGDGTPLGSGGDEEPVPKEEKELPKQGKLLVDATCVPADIRFPTDLGVLNEAREKLEEIIDVLYESVRSEVKKPRTYRNQARKAFLQVSRNRKPRKNQIRNGIRKQLQYVRRDLKHIAALRELSPLSSLSKRAYKNLLVVSEVFRQQEEMYRKGIHAIPGRIVSVSQPHVRPIVRGKARAAVEFGAKISVSRVDGYAFLETVSWEPYHEGNELIAHIEAYKLRYGYYPVSVHADKIYRTRENLRYCKDLGIRLAGPKLGRPPKDKELHKAILKASRADEIERIPIEGVFGVAKRAYSLGRLKEKLQKTSETTIALVILGMNLKKILRDLSALLIRLFGELRFQLILIWKPAEIL